MSSTATDERVDKLIAELNKIKHLSEQQQERLVQLDGVEPAAEAYRKLITHRNQIADWLIEEATTYGEITKSVVDSALGGEDFLPCSFQRTVDGKKYAIDLVSTEYRITEVE